MSDVRGQIIAHQHKMENRTLRKANGLRRGENRRLTADEIEHLKTEIAAIDADIDVFDFEKHIFTGYVSDYDQVNIAPNVFPDLNSTSPRDRMSERAVLAHEYYGHRTHRNTTLNKGSWNDEFRASYIAAKITPNLSNEDRQYLILDALDRAKESGVNITLNSFMTEVLYGYKKENR